MHNEPAFPTTQYANGVSPTGHDQGMTLRDYFAAKAMHHWLSLPIDDHQRQKVAVEAYKVADAMMEARK
jgi:hypothetical protein